MPQAKVDLGAVERFLASQDESPAMVKNAVSIVQPAPPAERMPEGFVANLQHELSQGGQHIASGVGTAYNSNDIRGVEQMGGVGEAALGGLQAMNAPVTAAARAAGQTAQDIVQPVAGEMAGAIAGTGVDTAVQMLGGPALGRIARATSRGLARVLPGFATGSRVARRAMMAEDAQSLAAGITTSKVEADKAYETLSNVYDRIPLPGLEKFADKLAITEARLGATAGKTLQNPKIRNIAMDLRESIDNNKQYGGLPFNDLKEVLKRLNDKMSSTPVEKRGELYGAYKNLKSKIYDAMENTRIIYKDANGVNKDAYTELRRADDMWRQASAGEDLQKFVTDATSYTGSKPTAFNADAVSNKIMHDDFFRDSVPPTKLKGILDTLGDISRRMPSAPAGMSERAGVAAAIAGTAGIAGHLSGVGPALTSPATWPGMTGAAGVVMGADFVIGEALKTKAGQAMLRKLFAKDALITPEKMAALSMVTRGATEAATALSRPKEQTVQVPAQ